VGELAFKTPTRNARNLGRAPDGTGPRGSDTLAGKAFGFAAGASGAWICSPIDGVYGRDTRAAILAWQNARGRAATGLIGDAEAHAIDGEVISKPLPDRVGPPALPSGTEEIALRNNGGVYVVPVRINEAITLDFIVDSGASDVLIPADVAMTLARTGTIAPGDFIGDREYRVADGSTLKSERFILRELKVGDRVLSNVVASIGSVKGELLLGQSFLARFGSWSIDNDRHLLALGRPRQ
jgi:clan AA aspartic protease (TIGR02281 family)